MHPAARERGRAVRFGTLASGLRANRKSARANLRQLFCFGLLLRGEGSVVRASAAWQNELIAGHTKCFVPRSSKAREKFLDCAPANPDAWVNHFSPGSDVGSFLRLLKSDPLGEGDANGVVDPPYFPSRNACGNYVVDDGIYGAQDFNLEAAAGLPRAAVAPA
jgi:hypothetical protein